MDTKNWLIIASILGGLGVVAGAFGAHFLEERISPSDLSMYKTAVQYQMYHSLAILLVVALKSQIDSQFLHFSALSFLIGIIVFSGSLYLLVLTKSRWLGAITPVGGIGFLIGWILLAYGAYKS